MKSLFPNKVTASIVRLATTIQAQLSTKYLKTDDPSQM